MDTNAHSELDQDDLDSKEMKNEDNHAFHTGNEESQKGTMEMFVNSENDNTEAMRDILLNRIKMEPNEYDWAECSGNNQGEFKADSCAVKEEVSIKKEDIEESIDPFDPDSHGINTGHSEGDNLNEYAASKEEIKIEPVAVKLEMDIDSEDFKISEITEEFIIKSDGETSMDASSDAAPNRTPKNIFPRKQAVYEKTDRKSFSCYSCNYTTYRKSHIIWHMKSHDKKSSSPSRLGLSKAINAHKHNTCIHCNMTFTRAIGLDDHIVRKHPEFIESLDRIIRECPHCIYKTIQKNDFDRHVLTHSSSGSSYKSKTCTHCDATFKSKTALDDHIVKTHLDYMSLVTKLYHCTQCNYKTSIKTCLDRHLLFHLDKDSEFMKSKDEQIYTCQHCTYKTFKNCNLVRHMLTHSEINSICKPKTCTHCGAVFKSKTALDDHIVKKHPDLISLVTTKLHLCTECSYKTTIKTCLDRHLLIHFDKDPEFLKSNDRKTHECHLCTYKTLKKHELDRHTLTHPETVEQPLGSHVMRKQRKKHQKCIHCDKAFRDKTLLDGHILKKHPEYRSTITSKLYKCSNCVYETTLKNDFNRHMLIHYGNVQAPAYKRMCTDCNVTFKDYLAFDGHIIQYHPDSMDLVTSQLYECKKCNYKTVWVASLHNHMSSCKMAL